ncbi:hypothetical protein R1sor_002011 [Riccia sorocarpa]|uniref:Uncharacterized protein n=1 Tax=Riccia sorocarpa TaxID=122646 RepID=A0ABD3H3I8_9MARC
MLVQRDNSRQSHDERVQELVLENAKLQERLDATQKQLTEAESDTRFMLRHNKRLEGELRKMKKHMLKSKRAKKVRKEETLSEGSVSTSDGDEQSGEDLTVALPRIRTPVEPRTSGDGDTILAIPSSSRSPVSGRNVPRVKGSGTLFRPYRLWRFAVDSFSFVLTEKFI